MDNYCISGSIGSGKSVFCKKIFSQKFSQYKNTIVWIEIDEIVRFWHAQKKIENFLYRAWEKNGVRCYSSGLKISKNKILFFSDHQQKKRAWQTLELIFHSLITSFILQTDQKNRNRKGTFLWDMALSELFPQNVSVQHIHIPSRKTYQTCFLLKRYRKISYKKIYFFLEKQKQKSNIRKNYNNRNK